MVATHQQEKNKCMLIEIVQAGIIDEAPTIYELLVRAIQKILTFVSGVAILGVIGSGIIYVASSGNRGQQRYAKIVLRGSVIGLVIALTSLVVVGAITGIFR